MSYSLFDIIGPITHGPSSNHTGGACRIGYYAYCIMGGTPNHITYGFHPLAMRTFKGHLVHIALMAGCLGMREDSTLFNDSEKMMAEKGIYIKYTAIQENNIPRNFMCIKGMYQGINWKISGDSIGGGNIFINQINGMDTKIDGNNFAYIYILKASVNLSLLKKLSWIIDCNCRNSEQYMFYLTTHDILDNHQLTMLNTIIGKENIICLRKLKPLHLFYQRSDKVILFSTFKAWQSLCHNSTTLDIVLRYEQERSGKNVDEILTEAKKIVSVMKNNVKDGQNGNNHLFGGLCDGNDGKRMMDWSKSSDTIVGTVFTKAIACALSVQEVNACAGIVVPAPTCGSCGTVAGTLLTVAERYQKNDDDVAKAVLVAAMAGVIIGNKSSFSGGVGGCQVEVGTASAMAAVGTVWLAGGSIEQITQAAALALKNVLGLICDPIAGPVEVPCIKRNAMGVAVALMSAEMALAGIHSIIPPDEVVDALTNTAKTIPTALRCSCEGGLASTKTAIKLRKWWNVKVEKK